MDIFLTEHFKQNAHKLNRKFPHLKDDLFEALDLFDEKKSIYIGRSIYKIRVKSRDINKGKSGGLRCYIYCSIKADLLVPLCIYFKSEQESIVPSELEMHFDYGISELIAKFGLDFF